MDILKKTSKDFLFVNILVFIGLQIILDIYRTLLTDKFQIFGISPVEILNILYFVYLCIIFLMLFRKKPKRFLPILIYGMVFLVYFSLHIWNMFRFDTSVINGTEINAFKELYVMVRVYLIPVIVLYMFLCCDFNMGKFEKATNFYSGFISLIIIGTNIFKISYVNYSSGLKRNIFITRNIFEWFTNPDYENPMFMTSKGWFQMGNQVSIILFMLFPLVIMQVFKYRKIFNYMLFLFQGIAMIMLGTKVAALGCLLISAVAFATAILFGIILKQFSFNAKNLSVFVLLIACLVAIFANSPIIEVQKAKNQAYVVTEEQEKNKEEIKEKLENAKVFENTDTDSDNSSQEIKESEFSKQLAVKEFANMINSNPYLFGIDREFIELFDVAENYKFWYDVVSSPDVSQVNYRGFKERIYKAVLKKNNNNFDVWLGIGYTTNFPYTERDFTGQNVWFGYIGTALFIGPYLVCALFALIEILKKFKSHFVFENVFWVISVIGTLCLSLMAGHLFYGIFSIAFFAFVTAGFYKFQIEVSN